MNTNAFRITGSDAIRLAERDQLTIHCHANPLDNGGVVSADVARQIVKDDPSLVYVLVSKRGWWDGHQRVSELPGYSVHDYFRDGIYLGPDDDGAEPTFDDAELE